MDLWLIHTTWEWDWGWYREQDWYNRKLWVLVPVPVSDQCEHFYIMHTLYFLFGPRTGPGPIPARFIRTDCMRRIRWSCEGLTSVHNEYTGYLLKHLLLRHMYNLPLPVLMCYAQALRSETSYCYCYCVSNALALYCTVLYILLV